METKVPTVAPVPASQSVHVVVRTDPFLHIHLNDLLFEVKHPNQDKYVMVTNNYALDAITGEPPAFVGIAVSSSLKGNDRCTATVAGAITTHGVFFDNSHRKVGARIGFEVDDVRRVWEGRDSNYKPPRFVKLPLSGTQTSNPPPLRYLHEDAAPGVDRAKNASYRFLLDKSTSDQQMVGTMQLGNALQHNIRIHVAHANTLFGVGDDGGTWLAAQPNK